MLLLIGQNLQELACFSQHFNTFDGEVFVRFGLLQVPFELANPGS